MGGKLFDYVVPETSVSLGYLLENHTHIFINIELTAIMRISK